MSSLSPSSSSSSSSSSKYDVFLSFRGEDTRLNFTDPLYAALQRNGIVTFKDDRKLEAGKEIAPELFKAIQQSWCSVIIFSETYPFSSWCLEELAEIVKQKKDRGHIIFPIFYGVDPSDLRNQKDKVRAAFAKHEERYKEDKDKIQRWRNALTEVANIKGWDSNNKHESEFISDIVKNISAKLPQTYPGVPDKLIGFDSRLKVMRSKIDFGKGGAHIIGICGMGGIGKTTLARVVYTQMSSHFEGKSFLADVRGVSKKDGLEFLQEQLLSQIFPGESFNLFNVYDGNAIICRRMPHKKVLVVIDDVDTKQHLECLVGKRDWFGSGSIIIVTTRDKHLLLLYGVDDVYEPTILDENEALQLLNLKAFDGAVPKDDFIRLSKQVVNYTGGLPLALVVLGSFLHGRGVAQWIDAIKRLERDSHKEIHDKLKISYDGLEESEKNIFLDIACFFNREEKDYVMKILDGSGFFPEIGIDVLVKKSLIKVEYGFLRMHDLLQEMGRKIVREKSVDEPGKRSRVWDETDVYHVLTENTATEAVEGMVIDIKRESNKTLTLSPDAFLKMQKLRMLRVFCRVNCHDLNYLSNALRFLEWREYPLRSLPSRFQPDNLVALRLSNSRIEQLWEGSRRLDNLKAIDLHGSKNLIKTPDFTMTPNLEFLNLAFCEKIVDVHPSIGVHRRLKRLDLGFCSNLRNLPVKIGMESLEELDLSSCSNLQSFPEIDGKMERLRELHLNGTGIEELPSSLGHLSGLKHLSLRDCKSLRILPTKFGMESLETLSLSGCSKIESIPEIDGKMENLRELYLGGTGIEELPSSIGHLSSLKHLSLRHCKSLRSLPRKIALESLETLTLSGCSNLESFPEIDGKMENLRELYLGGTGIEELASSIGHLSSLKHLSLRYCKSLRSLPREIGMESLETLMLSGCSNLESFPEIDGKMEKLRWLYLDGTGIKELPSSIGNLSSLALLNLQDCSNLVSLPSSIDGCKSLKTLNLSGCYKVENLPDNLQHLEKLHFSETAIIKTSSFISQFKNLKCLSFNGRKEPSSNLSPNPPSIFKGIQRGRMDSVALVLSQLSGLRSLTCLSLIDCNLCDGDITKYICCLSSLKELDPRGNNFIDIPATLTRLSNLQYLRLSNCRELKSLPSLLTSIGFISVDGCASLEVVENPSKVCNSTYRTCFLGRHCYKLAENIDALTLLKKHLKVFANSRKIFDIIMPGSEIPEWFGHQRGDSSITIPLPLNIRNDSQWMGVALCCVFVNDDASRDECICCEALIDGRQPGVSSGCVIQKKFYQPIVKDHLFLSYWSRDIFYPVSLKDKCGGHGTDNLSSTNCSDRECHELQLLFNYYHNPVKVKKCGVRIVYGKDLEEVEQISEQHSSQSSANFEEIHEHSIDDGSIGNGSLAMRKRNTLLDFEEAEEEPQPIRWKRIFNCIMGPLVKIHQVWLKKI